MNAFFRKTILILATSLVAVLVAASDEDEAEPVIITDPAVIYTKALWRRPLSDDKILHAERREWLDTEGNVARWEWFLVFEPSSATRAWLATNPFLLSPATASTQDLSPTEPPDWFDATAASKSKLQNARGSLTLAYSLDGRSLYATDSGSGFAPQN